MKRLLCGTLLSILFSSAVSAQPYHDSYRYMSRQQLIMEVERLRQENARLRQQGGTYAPYRYGSNNLSRQLDEANRLKQSWERLTR